MKSVTPQSVLRRLKKYREVILYPNMTVCIDGESRSYGKDDTKTFDLEFIRKHQLDRLNIGRDSVFSNDKTTLKVFVA